MVLLLIGRRGYAAPPDHRKYAGAAKPPPHPHHCSEYLTTTKTICKE
jgi:hypothetical protein